MYNNIKNSIIKLMPFAALYNYESELIREVRSIKIIVKKVRILIIQL